MPTKTEQRAGLLGLALGLALVGACRSAPPPAPPSGQLALELLPAQASVLIDDRPLVRRADGPLRASLPVGAHRVEVYAPGYFHAYREVTVAASGTVQLRVVLRADPDADSEKPAGAERNPGLIPPLAPRPTAGP
jgi:hypothetical protein